MSGANERANGRASGSVLMSRFLFVPDHSAAWTETSPQVTRKAEAAIMTNKPCNNSVSSLAAASVSVNDASTETFSQVTKKTAAAVMKKRQSNNAISSMEASSVRVKDACSDTSPQVRRKARVTVMKPKRGNALWDKTRSF